MSLEGLQLGRYRLLSVLGSGGMGEVYQAEDMHIHRHVAIKVVRMDTSPYPNSETAHESERLFRREVRAIATLDHPHILPLFDYGEETAHGITYTYMVMPLRKEGSLSIWLRQRPSSSLLAPQEVAHIIRQAASALQYAHGHQIIHQDVKPSNFLIRSDEEHPNLPDLLLADFGIARFHTATSSMSQTSRGTPTYMAPEQWSGSPVPATDQYALAIMTYQLLTGNLPFQGRQEQVMYQHFNAQPQPPGKLNPRIPAGVDAVVLRALAKEPGERFPTISAFAQALTQALPTTSALAAETAPSPGMRASGVMPTVTPPATGNDLRATLAISEGEAAAGAARTLTLPGGRKVTVMVPANVSDGHVVYLPSPDASSQGTLVVTIAVKRAEEELAELAQSSAPVEKTFRSDPGKAPVAAPAVSSAAASGNRATWSKGLPRPSRGQATLLICLVALIVLGSLGTFYFTSFNYIQRLSLLNARIADPYASYKTLALNDPLSNNSNGYFWNDGANATGSCTFAGGFYLVSTTLPAAIQPCSPSPTFSNFAYEVQMTITQGDYGGVIFRADTDNSRYYYVLIGQDGSYRIGIGIGRSSQQLLDNSTSTAIKTGLGQTNLIAVVANGNTITAYVNGQSLTTVNDSTYSQGQIGVAADDEGNPSEVVFQNARVWTF